MADYLIKEETLTAMGNNVRSHMNNTASRYSPEEMTTALDESIDYQTDLIAQIQAAANNLPEAGSGGGSGNSGGSYDEGYNAGYADGEATALEGYIDWNIATTSSSCFIYFCNNHPSYSVSISFIVYEYNSGEEYSNDVIIAAGGEYLWDETNMSDIVFTEGEWELAVTEMRFMKDGT